jgi:hypothetical protein
MPLCGISKNPEEQGVSIYVRASQFFLCENVFSSHYLQTPMLYGHKF